jgi:hypothetical protein
MKIQIAVLSIALLFTLPLSARSKTDVIVMNNGDRMTCEIKGLDQGALSVSFDYIKGTTSVDWSKVHHLESNQLFIVKAEDGSVYVGMIKAVDSAAGRPIQIVPAAAPEEMVEVKHSEVIDLTQTSANFWQRFNGSLNSGINYAKGNNATQYNFSANVDYPRERWGAGASFNSSLSANEGSPTSTRNSLAADTRRLLRQRNWYYAGLANFLQSSTQEIQLQSNIGAGIGRFIKNTNRATITATGGLSWQKTNYSQVTNSQASESVIAAMAVADMSLFRFNKTNLTVTVSAFPALSQPGRVYANTDVSYYLKFWGNFTWTTSFYGNWDNQPPPHFVGSNYGASSGIGWTFGNN